MFLLSKKKPNDIYYITTTKLSYFSKFISNKVEFLCPLFFRKSYKIY